MRRLIIFLYLALAIIVAQAQTSSWVGVYGDEIGGAVLPLSVESRLQQAAQDAAEGATAYGWGDHSAAGYLTGVTWAIITGDADVYTLNRDGLRIDDSIAMTESTIYYHGIPAAPGLPHAVTAASPYVWDIETTRMLARLEVTTTNDMRKSNATLVFWLDGNQIGQLWPACDGTTQDVWFAATPGDEFKITAIGLPSPGDDDADPIVTRLRFHYMGNPKLVGRPIETANQILTVDSPDLPRQAANRRFVEGEAAAAMDLALDEVWHRTQPTDLQGQFLRFSPRYDLCATNNLLNIKYGGETVFQFDGTGVKVIPEIRSFSVGAGATAEMTVWSYSGGATNLVPEVSTNLQEWVRLGTNAILSAEMIDSYTAKVIFTNASERLQFVRLVDVSGGEGVPVARFLSAVELGGETRTNWPTGGGGGGHSSILVTADWTWSNNVYAIGADTTATNIALTLPDGGTNFESIVVRKFSNANELRILRGTNVVYTLHDDGAARAYDWWPQRTNWYWRQ